MDDVSTCIDALKKLPRTGWMQRGVPASVAETVAAHSYEASVISGILASKVGVNVERAMALAIIHDMAECRVGDLPLYSSAKLGGVKEDIELKAVEELGLPKQILDLYREWVSQETAESRVARVGEKIATLIEARRLRSAGYQRCIEIEESIKKQLNDLLSRSEYAFLRKASEEVAGPLTR